MTVNLGTAEGKIRLDTSQVDKATKSAGDTLKRFQNLGTTALLGVGAAGVAGFGLAVRSAVQMNASLETSELQFETLMGSADKAHQHVKNLFDFAKRTPFETGPIIEASRMLETFGGAALNTMANIELIGDASAAVNAPINELGFWVGRLYSNLQGGQPFGEAAMRLQELAVLQPEVRQRMVELQESGASAAEVFAVFQGGLERFTGSMEKQAATWNGLVSTFKDSVAMSLGDALRPLTDSLRDQLSVVVEALGSEEMQARIREFAGNLASLLETVIPLAVQYGPTLLKVMGGLAAVLSGLLVTVKVAAAVAALQTAFAGASAAVAAAGGGLAGLAALLGPVTIAVGAVVGVVALLGKAWASNWLGIRDHTAKAVEFIKGVISRGLAAIRGWWAENGEGITRAVRATWDFIRDLIELRLANLRSLFQAFQAIFSGDWRTAGEKIREIWDRTMGAIVDALTALDEKLRAGLTALAGKIGDWWKGIDWEHLGENAGERIKNGLKNVVQHINELDQQAQQSLNDFFGGLLGTGEDALTHQGEMAQVAGEGYDRFAESAERADAVLFANRAEMEESARRMEILNAAFGDGSDGITELSLHTASFGDGLKLAADRADKAGGAVDRLTQFVSANKAAAEAAAERVSQLHESFLAIQGDYTTELPSGDKPLVTPEATFTVTTGGLTEDDAKLLEQYRGEAEKLQQEISDLTNGIGTFGVEQEKINEKLAGAQGELDHYRKLMAPLEGVVEDVTTAHRGLSVNVDAVHQGIYDELVQMGAAPEVVTAYAVATGIMSEEQARAALQAAAVKVKIEELATKMAEGLPIETALADLDSFIQKIETGVTPAAETLATDVPARVTEMKDAMAEESLAAGEAVPAGITEGINTKLEEATTAAEDAATDVVDAVKHVFGVESPSTVFADIGGELMAGLQQGIEDNTREVELEIVRLSADIIDAFDYAVDRAPNVGKAIILGVIAGVEDYRGMLVAKMKEIARQAYQEAMDEIYAHSPSRLFMNMGHAIIDGIVVGLEQREARLTAKINDIGHQLGGAAAEIGGTVGLSFMEAIRDIREGMWADILQQLHDAEHPEDVDTYLESLGSMYLDFANQLAGIASGFGDVFEATVIDPIQAKLDDATDGLETYDDTILGLADSLGLVEQGLLGSNQQLLDWDPAQAAAFIETLQSAPFAGIFDTDQLASLNVLQGLLHDRNGLLADQAALQAELTEEMERQAALEEKRSQLKFLQDQMELIELIRENGLSTSILDGLTLGLDADAGALMDAMVAAMSELVTAAEDELDIASPSGVFREIGARIMDGLERGIAGSDPAAALQEQLDGLTRVFDPARSPADALAEHFFEIAAGIRDGAGDVVDAMVDSAGALNEAALQPGAALQQQIDGLGRAFDMDASTFAVLQNHPGQLPAGAALRARLPMRGPSAPIADGQALADALREYLGEARPANATPAAASPAGGPRQNVYIFGGYNPQVDRQPAIDPIRDLYYRGL